VLQSGICPRRSFAPPRPLRYALRGENGVSTQDRTLCAGICW
jgi:hypothetical protein